MAISTKQVLKILYILSWIIFVGLSIDAGGFISNAFYTIVINPAHARHFWRSLDFSSLYKYDSGYFLLMAFFMSLVTILKAIIFYGIIKILHNKKLSLSQPFSKEALSFIFTISYLAFLIGLFSGWGVKYAEWFTTQGVQMPDIRYLLLDGADVWMFMSVILFVIAQIFKRGIEIQTENELTV